MLLRRFVIGLLILSALSTGENINSAKIFCKCNPGTPTFAEKAEVILSMLLTARGMAFFTTALVPLQEYMASLNGRNGNGDNSMAGAIDESPDFGPVQYKLAVFVSMEEMLQAKDDNGGVFCCFYTFPSSDEPCLSCSTVSPQAFRAPMINISLNGSDLSPPSL